MYPSALSDITRKSTGIGIVCGLEVLVTSGCTLIVTSGYGFTSTGRLIHFQESHFKYYRPFKKGVKGLLPADADIEVWELTVSKEDHTTPITLQVISEERFIDNKVVLLYIEDKYENVRDHYEIKTLVIDKEDLWKLIDKKNEIDIACISLTGKEPNDTDLFKIEEEFPSGQLLHCATNRATLLSPIYTMRFGFATAESECDVEGKQAFRLASANFEGLFQEYELIILDALEQLQDSIIQLHQKTYHDLFSKQQRDYLDRYFKYLTGARWLKFKKNSKTKIYIQYFYDFVIDLVTTYNELVQELCSLMADCCPDQELFPCHLLLGEVQEDVTFGHSVFRHHFRQPPIYNGNQARLQKIRFLHWRMVIQIKNFYIPHVESTDIAEGHYTQIDKNDKPPEIIKVEKQLDHIKLTPSKQRHLPLGKRSIPFYYYVAAEPSSIHHFWDFEATYCCKTSHLLSYHAGTEDGHTDKCAAKRPLSHEAYPFRYFRIEGVIGQTKSEALVAHLNKYRQSCNLDFQVLFLNYEEFLEAYNNGKDFRIHSTYLGAAHIGGVEKGGYYILLHDDAGKIKADFWLGSCCLENIVRGKVINTCDKEDKGAIQIGFRLDGDTIFPNEKGVFRTSLEEKNYHISLLPDSQNDYYILEKFIQITPAIIAGEYLEIRVVQKVLLKVKLNSNDATIETGNQIVELLKGDEILATATSDEAGLATFNENKLEEGNYSIRWIERSLSDDIEIIRCQKDKFINLLAIKNTGKQQETNTPLKPKVVSNLGPATVKCLKEKGIDTFEKLAAITVENLKAIMVASGKSSLMNVDVSEWPKQAQSYLDELEQLKTPKP